MREIRTPPERSIFNSRIIGGTDSGELYSGPWYRLYQKKFPSQFFPSEGSRLTPASYRFPCIYLGTTHETVVAEVYGDKYALRQAEGHTTVAIAKTVAQGYAYLRCDSLPSSYKICDLLNSNTRAAVGIDTGTLMTIDFAVTQQWAELIANHPIGFDGIQYRSRHTDEPCLVIWNRPDGSGPVLEGAFNLRGRWGVHVLDPSLQSCSKNGP